MARKQADLRDKAKTHVISACRLEYLKARLERKREEHKGLLLNAVMYQDQPKLEAAE
ncbi:hypothetical protein [Hyphomicrobium sp.]|uniref:hypothetical protein n=1 Tax=Hyphomicrobium sp. TaxID=82 RepID=UPI001D525BF6|nr:hypothetical protein [Hyphomicrobium sp.]MBY0559927.1 hypothetical protein [Hyphomicrobium sp.]